MDKLLILKNGLVSIDETRPFFLYLSASPTKSGNRCKVIVMNCGGKHSYHLVSEDSKEVFGRVNPTDVIK